MRRKDLPPDLLDRVEAVSPSDLRPRADRMILVLPFPPSTNNLFRSFKLPNGKIGRAKTSAAKKYSEFVVEAVKAWTLEHRAQPPIGPYQLILAAWPPDDKRRHDLSNLFKCVEDSIFEAIREGAPEADDDEVHEIFAIKLARSEAPCIEVQLVTRPSVTRRPHPGAVPGMLPARPRRRRSGAASARTVSRSTTEASA